VEIKARIAAGNRCLLAVQKMLHFRMMSLNAQLLIYKTVIRRLMTYASVTWVLAKKSALNTWITKIMRKIYGPINEGGQWRIRTNAELQELYRKQDLVALV
jgi:hypothetical protein